MARADVVKTIPKFKYFTLLSTLVYVGGSMVLLAVGMGAAGLFLANAINFAMRLVISWNV